MYTVTFINSNGQNISIKNVAEIEYGDSCDSMDKIPSEKNNGLYLSNSWNL